ncbi:MAG: trigger factor [Candidatus Binatia bacterium]|nr:trigger factor [Candidatus Binatia bacterium]
MQEARRKDAQDQQLTCSIEEIDPVHVRVKVKIPAERVDAAIQGEFASLARTARVPGFRPGRVPKELLEKRFWPLVRDAVQRELVSESFAQAIKGKKFRPTGAFELEQVSLKPGEPLVYSALVEVLPDIGKVEYAGLEIELPPMQVTEEEVEAVLGHLQTQHTTLIPVEESRPIQAGDVVEVTFLDSRDRRGVAPRKRLFWLHDADPKRPLSQLLGSRVGECVEISLDSSSPQRASAEDEELRSQRERVRVDAIYERRIPTLDDDFAKTVSTSSETLEDLRSEIRVQLRARMERERELLLRSRLRLALAEANASVRVPPSLLRRETELLVKRYLTNVRLPPERFENFLQRNPDVADALQREAYIRVASDILLLALAEQEGLQVTETELEEFIDRLAERSGEEAARVRAYYSAPAQREELKRELLSQRALELVRQRAQIREQDIRERAEDTQIADQEGNG